MRKIFTLLVALFFVACTKDVKVCWICTTVTQISTYSYGSWTPSDPTSRTFSECDKTETEIKQVQKDGTHVKTTPTQTISDATTCSKQ